jgi:hypothetical protein
VLDLRDKEHLTIVYERTKPDISFLWLGWMIGDDPQVHCLVHLHWTNHLMHL